MEKSIFLGLQALGCVVGKSFVHRIGQSTFSVVVYKIARIKKIKAENKMRNTSNFRQTKAKRTSLEKTEKLERKKLKGGE